MDTWRACAVQPNKRASPFLFLLHACGLWTCERQCCTTSVASYMPSFTIAAVLLDLHLCYSQQQLPCCSTVSVGGLIWPWQLLASSRCMVYSRTYKTHHRFAFVTPLASSCLCPTAGAHICRHQGRQHAFHEQGDQAWPLADSGAKGEEAEAPG